MIRLPHSSRSVVTPPSNLRLNALAFLYDRMADLPSWMRRLSPEQLETLVKIMLAWHGEPGRSTQILPLAEIEKRETIRAISLCNGDMALAAKALKVGKTTLYRKIKRWGYSSEERAMLCEAAALVQAPSGR